MLTTTLNNIRAHSPCTEGWTNLLAGLNKTQADDEPLPYAHILEINGLADTLWCMRAEPQHRRVWAEFALWCAEQVKRLTRDGRSLHVLEVTRRYLDGYATLVELRAACDAAAAYAAADAAAAAAAAAADAAYAAAAAADAAADAAAYAACAADAAVYAAAAYAGVDADAHEKQAAKLLELVTQEPSTHD